MTSSIVGVGSPFGEDQCGWYVIDLLQQTHSLSQAALHKSDRPGLKLIETMRAHDYVMIVDALNCPDSMGQFFELNYKQLKVDSLLSSHGFGVAHALQLASHLYGLPPKLQLYGVAMNPQHRAMSTAVKQACQRLSQCLLTQFTENGTSS